ncbi:hypothetical protein [Streptomyces mirabilis]|uniref:hypothetical protein n=1 Tax=Streptomyces mirabilis TaxID=68239 RepID=UPI0036AAC10F
MAGEQTPDPLVREVERVIENHLPGGTAGVDIRSMARAVVRRVRQEQARERLAEVTSVRADTRAAQRAEDEKGTA